MGDHSFREVVVDQPFGGKWMEVDMNLGGGHSSFQGSKFSDFAGGFSYRGDKPVVRNRGIYWRTLNDTLELTEFSLDFDLVDNQVRYIFQGSPIAGPVSIQETESSVVILVPTVTSVNRFLFHHPKRLQEAQTLDRGAKPSIFQQICNKPQMNFRSFNLYENAINIPVPLCATCYYVETRAGGSGGGPAGGTSRDRFHPSQGSLGGECFFSFSFESGSIHVYKISPDDVLLMYDLKQANLFTRFFGFTSSLIRTPQSATDSAIGVSFFSKEQRNGDVTLFLVTLSMKGQLTLWTCPKLDVFTEWTSYYVGLVNDRFAIDGYTDSSMLLRKNEVLQGPPTFSIYIPGDGFKFYKPVKLQPTGIPAGSGQGWKYGLALANKIDFDEREAIDFCVTADRIFVLLTNPEEECEWSILTYKLDGSVPRFLPISTEPLPSADLCPSLSYLEAKDFYMTAIFNESSFTSSTITKALTMFRKEEDEPMKEHQQDWEALKITAMNMIDREIALETSGTEYDISDDEFTELSVKYWLMFYNSCVEYHVHTVKPLGLFHESGSGLICVVKKHRISFLRPTDLLETLYYSPQSFNIPPIAAGSDQDDEHYDLAILSKFLELVSALDTIQGERENLSVKLDKRLRENVNEVPKVAKEIAKFLLTTDPSVADPESRNAAQIINSKLKEISGFGTTAMRRLLLLISSWDNQDPEGEERDEGFSEYFMSSRLGAHLTYKIVRQMMDLRSTISRNLMILQELVISFFSQNRTPDFLVEYDDTIAAKNATVAYYALLSLGSERVEDVPPFMKERGLKVANILRLLTAEDGETVGGSGALRLLESFCLSKIGRLGIRKLRTRGGLSSDVLAQAVGVARCIWTNSGGNFRPLEDYLVVSCQYLLLLKYARFLGAYLGGELEEPIKQFYFGLANLCLGKEEVGLSCWKNINFREGLLNENFCLKVLNIGSSISSVSLFNSFYVKAVAILQVIGHLPGVKGIANDGLQVASNDEEVVKMCSLGFKCAMQLGDYESAYDYILKMPNSGSSSEKSSSLRTFVTQLVQKGGLDTLLTLDTRKRFSSSSSVREHIEGILFAQANLSDPLSTHGVYQILYALHLCRQNFHKAATTMYYRAMRIGDSGGGKEALLAQKEAYLDLVSCLNLVNPKQSRMIIKKTGIQREQLEEVSCFDPEENPGQVFNKVRVPLLPNEREVIVITLEEIEKELALLVALSKLDGERPVRPMDFPRRAEKGMESLALNHHYDEALKLGSLWDLDLSGVIGYFADICCSLVYAEVPDDPAIYFRHNEVSHVMTGGEIGYAEMAFRLLQSYLRKAEKEWESRLHQVVTLKFLAAGIELPQWLVASYKKRNVHQLLHCYLRYGEWERAGELVLRIFDAALGRVSADEFDCTVRKLTAYEPVEAESLPFNLVDVLASRLKLMPEYKELYDKLRTTCSVVCDRIDTCSRERRNMFQNVQEVK